MTGSRVANPHPLDLEHDRVVLSNREAQVIQKTRHKSYEEVGEDLGIAESTVGTYYSRANSKLGEQVTVIEAMLDQQHDARRDENIEAVARYAVERLRDRGLDVELKVQGQKKKEDETSVDTSKQPDSSTTAPVDKSKFRNKDKPVSDDTVKIGSTGVEMPVRIGEAINEEGTNYASCDEEIMIRYWRACTGCRKYIWLNLTADKIMVEVEYEESVEGCRKIVESDKWEYKKLGFAYRRLYRECGVDLDDHNLSFDFSQ